MQRKLGESVLALLMTDIDLVCGQVPKNMRLQMLGKNNSAFALEEIFNRIDEVIRKIDQYKLPAFDADVSGRLAWNASVELTDSQILRKLIELIAYSQQAKAVRVTKIIEDGLLQEVFQNYNVDTVSKMDQEVLRKQYWNQIGAIRFPQKLESMIGSAIALKKISLQYGSFSALLKSSNLPSKLADGYDVNMFWRSFAGLQYDLQLAGMPFFNNLTSLCHLLMVLGYPCLKPDSAVMGSSIKLGMIQKGSSVTKPNYNDKQRQQVVKNIQDYCVNRQFDIRVIDCYLLVFGGQSDATRLVRPGFYD